MAEQTTNLKLSLFGKGLAGDVLEDEPADISGINANMKTIDQFIGMAYVCTSDTRPSNPFKNLGIYETDTKRGYIHDGVTFQLVFDANFTTGLKGTSAQRDAYWGSPSTGSTTPEQQNRAALANQAPRWYNTEKGYEEQYFAKTDDVGALPGFQAFNPGWFPSGAGLVPQAFVSYVPPKVVTLGAGFTLFTTNTMSATPAPNAPFFQEMGKPVGGVTYGKLDGTAPGMRLTPGIDGIWRIHASATLNFGTFNLFVKKDSVSADYTNLVASQSAGGGYSSIASAEIHKEVRLSATNFLILGIGTVNSGQIATSYEDNMQFGIEWVRPRTR